MPKTKCPLFIVPRLERCNGRWRPLLALYEAEGRRGWRLSCYSPDEGHSGMVLGYYKTTRPPNAAALTLAKQYAKGLEGATIRHRLPRGASE